MRKLAAGAEVDERLNDADSFSEDEEKFAAAAAARFDARFRMEGAWDWIPRDVQWAISLVARCFDVSAENVLSARTLTEDERDPRALLVYLLNTEGAITMGDIARRLDLDVSGVSRMCERVEKWRADVRWDRFLQGVSDGVFEYRKLAQLRAQRPEGDADTARRKSAREGAGKNV